MRGHRKARETLAADEPLEQPVTSSGTISATSLTLPKPPFGGVGGPEAEPQSLVAGKEWTSFHGGTYS